MQGEEILGSLASGFEQMMLRLGLLVGVGFVLLFVASVLRSRRGRRADSDFEELWRHETRAFGLFLGFDSLRAFRVGEPGPLREFGLELREIMWVPPGFERSEFVLSEAEARGVCRALRRALISWIAPAQQLVRVDLPHERLARRRWTRSQAEATCRGIERYLDELATTE